MNKEYIEGKTYKGTDFSKKEHYEREYENCFFSDCNFSNAKLSDLIFVDCSFVNCNLSLAKTVNTAFRAVAFKSCKMLGLHFDDCNTFLLSMDFEACNLNLSSFYSLSMKKTNFKDCSLHEVDFTETILSGSNIIMCDLSGAIFSNTHLQKVDFRTSYNFSIDPETNRIQKAKFSLTEVTGLLDKYNIEIE